MGMVSPYWFPTKKFVLVDFFSHPTLHPPYRGSFEPSRLKTIPSMFIDPVLRYLKAAAQNERITSWGFLVRAIWHLLQKGEIVGLPKIALLVHLKQVAAGRGGGTPQRALCLIESVSSSQYFLSKRRRKKGCCSSFLISSPNVNFLKINI